METDFSLCSEASGGELSFLQGMLGGVFLAPAQGKGGKSSSEAIGGGTRKLCNIDSRIEDGIR